MFMGGGSAYFQTKRGSSNAGTTIIAFAILLMLNVGGLSLDGPFEMMHYLSFAYMLNGSFMILHGLMADMEFTRKSRELLAVAIGVLGIVEGFSMAVLAVCVKMLVTG
ncbi:hypothetical protein MTO96_012102 [Rhipicephalus appendiculatus]